MNFGWKLKTTTIVTFAVLSGSGELFAERAADSPVELVRRVAQTEIAVSNGNVVFSDHRKNADGSWTKLMAEHFKGWQKCWLLSTISRSHQISAAPKTLA